MDGMVRKAIAGESGRYSIYYLREGYETRALDWGWREKGIWTASYCEGLTVNWAPFDEERERIRRALLKHFWLENWEDEFSYERIVKMSPRELAKERRSREAEDPKHLLKVVMISDTLGYHIEAEDHPDE